MWNRFTATFKIDIHRWPVKCDSEVFRSSFWEEFWKKCVHRNSCAFTLKLCENSWKKKCEVSLPATLLQKMNFFTVIFHGSWPVFKTADNSINLLVIVYLCLWTFTFVEIIIFFYFQVFLVFSLKRHIGFFEDTLFILVFRLPVWTCLLQTGGDSPHFDKNDIFWGELPLIQKVEEYPWKGTCFVFL